MIDVAPPALSRPRLRSLSETLPSRDLAAARGEPTAKMTGRCVPCDNANQRPRARQYVVFDLGFFRRHARPRPRHGALRAGRGAAVRAGSPHSATRQLPARRDRCCDHRANPGNTQRDPARSGPGWVGRRRRHCHLREGLRCGAAPLAPAGAASEHRLCPSFDWASAALALAQIPERPSTSPA